MSRRLNMSKLSFERSIEAKRELKKAEADGLVADNLDVRKALLAQVEDGKITLVEAQAQLKKIKRQAKAQGKLTRNSFFR
jgi:hypothetical protein